MAKEIINEEFELPEHLQEPSDTTDVEIEIVDDTPEADRGRKPLSAEEESDREDELDHLSKNVQKRINQINHKYHDERREKERLAREHAEAMRIAQAIYIENERLKQTIDTGYQEYAKEAQTSIESQEKLAEDRYRRAADTGDTDAMLAAQKELSALVLKKDRLLNMQIPSLQTHQQPVYNQPNVAPQAQAPARDVKAEEWHARNPWFQKDKQMTSLAYGLHEELEEQGVPVSSEEYYKKIDARMREVFPEKFGLTRSQNNASPVASVGRTTASKKITLTASQVAIAKRLGVPLEVYAKHAAKEQTING